MLEQLATLDQTLFLFFNVQMANQVTDLLMPIVTSDWLLRVLYGLAVILMLWKGDRKLRWLVVMSALTLLFTDQLSAGILKPLIGRPRPCHIMESIHLLVPCGSGKSMPSSHAANAFGQALLFSLHYPKVRWHLLALATVIAVSRVFVGVHYPGDILGGMILGGLIGLGFAYLFLRYEKRMICRGHKN